MVFYLSTYYNKDNRYILAPCYYICLNVCKQTKDNLFIPISWENFMWIVTRANIEHLKKWNELIVPCDFLHLTYDDSEYIPNDFYTSWTESYKLNKNGTIKRKNGKPIIREIHYEYTWEDYISEAAFESLNIAILKWKIYGKFYVAISLLLYSIKSKLITKFKKEK